VRDSVDNAFASLRSSVGIVNDYYGSSLALGRGNRLTDNVVFKVLTPPEPPDGSRYYWRARVFDIYEDGEWKSSLTTNHNVNPNDFDLTFPQEANRSPSLYSFSFTIESSIATIFTAPQAQWVSRPARAELAYNEDGTADLGSLRATPALRAGETYHVRSSLPDVTIAEMREAGSDYPEWVSDRYLAVPETVTPRTRELAQAIGGDLETPYDKAASVTAFLRSQIEYSETIPELPQDQELLDWFLFDPAGLLQLLASAEVILLRLLGVPARLAVGYASGEPEEVTDVYVVRQRDAHAWVEVYFPGLGWVEFEPTAGQPELLRPLGEALNSPAAVPLPNTLDELRDRLNRDLQLDQPSPTADAAAARRANLWRIAVSAALILVLGLILVPMGWKRQLLEKLPPIPIILRKECGGPASSLLPPAALGAPGRLSPLARLPGDQQRS
jgi:transglutaminase-like putative cysteine protease